MDKYEIERKLGEGGFGAAYLVKAKDSGQRFVMKRVHCESEEESKEGLKEMILLKVLRSPFVVKCFDFFTDKRDVFIIMEFAEGGDLNRVIDAARRRKQPIDEATVLRYFVEVCLGLECVHSNSILHRDLKPANVFLHLDTCKIGDFGISKLIEKQTETNHTAIGTLGFLAPEVLEGAQYGSKADLYSLGCTLYELLHLHSSYSDMATGKFPAPIPSVYSSELASLLSSLVDPNPANRPSITDILELDFLQDTKNMVNREKLIHNAVQERDDEIRMLKLEKSMNAPGARALSIKKAATMSKAERSMALREMERAAEEEKEKANEKEKAKESMDLDDAFEIADEKVERSLKKTPEGGGGGEADSRWMKLHPKLKQLLIDSPTSLLVPLITSLHSFNAFRKTSEQHSLLVKTRWLLALTLFLPPAIVVMSTMVGVILHVLSSYFLPSLLVFIGLVITALLSERVRQSVARTKSIRQQILFILSVPVLLLISVSIGMREFDLATVIAAIAASSLPLYCAAALSEASESLIEAEKEKEKEREENEHHHRPLRIPTPLERVTMSSVAVTVLAAVFSTGQGNSVNVFLLSVCAACGVIGANGVISNSHMRSKVSEISDILTTMLRKWIVMGEDNVNSISTMKSITRAATMSSIMISSEILCACSILAIIQMSFAPFLLGLVISLLAAFISFPLLLAATGKLGVVAYRIGFGVGGVGLWGLCMSGLVIGWAALGQYENVSVDVDVGVGVGGVKVDVGI